MNGLSPNEKVRFTFIKREVTDIRKLAWAALSFATAIFLCHYLIPQSVRLLFIPMFVVIGMIAIVIVRRKTRMGILLICVFASLGIVRYDIHADKYLGVEENLIGNRYRITAYVAEYPVVNDSYTKITVHLRTDLLPEVKTVLYDFEQILTDPEELEPGDMIRTTVHFASASVSSSEETDAYISKGIYLRGYFKDDVTIYKTRWRSFLYFPLRIAHEIRNTLDQILPQRTAVFMKALITGEKTALYDMPEIYNTLSRAGLSHIVAVSGMHISFLVSILMIFFGARSGRLLAIISLVVFSVMTGLSPSVLRAFFMQTLFLLAPVLRREADGITSICFALLVLLLLNPFAVASISLQLSFAAMTGILVITPKAVEWFKEKGKNLNRAYRTAYMMMASSISTSLGASLFTAPLCAFYFGNISILAPITNLLVLWIVPYCFGLGFAVCAAAPFSSWLASMIAKLLSWMVEFIYMIAEYISNIPFSSLYLPAKLMCLWLLCTGIVIAVTYYIKNTKAYKPLFSLVFACVTLWMLCAGVKYYYNNGSTVAAIDVGQGQCVAIMNEDKTILVDCGGAYDSGQTAVEWLYSHGRDRVDLLIISHFDSDHINGIVDLMTQIKINEIRYCSLNISESESILLKEIIRYAERCGTTLSITNKSTETDIGNIALKLFLPKTPKDNNGIIVLAEIKGVDVLVLGDADMNTEAEFLRTVNLPDGEYIVAGHHGSKYSTSEALLDRFHPEFAFISCGYNQHGHPTQEVLDRLSERNVVIYRTDMLGSIEMKVR